MVTTHHSTSCGIVVSLSDYTSLFPPQVQWDLSSPLISSLISENVPFPLQGGASQLLPGIGRLQHHCAWLWGHCPVKQQFLGHQQEPPGRAAQGEGGAEAAGPRGSGSRPRVGLAGFPHAAQNGRHLKTYGWIARFRNFLFNSLGPRVTETTAGGPWVSGTPGPQVRDWSEGRNLLPGLRPEASWPGLGCSPPRLWFRFQQPWHSLACGCSTPTSLHRALFLQGHQANQVWGPPSSRMTSPSLMTSSATQFPSLSLTTCSGGGPHGKDRDF